MISYAPEQGSVGPHTDEYDVFLIQANGRREWSIENQLRECPELLPDLDLAIMSDFQADQSWILEPGDILYLPPKILRLRGKSTVEEIVVVQKDMPNFFVEAVTLADGRAYSEAKEIVVPPEERILNIEVLPSSETYKPGAPAKVDTPNRLNLRH